MSSVKGNTWSVIYLVDPCGNKNNIDRTGIIYANDDHLMS